MGWTFPINLEEYVFLEYLDAFWGARTFVTAEDAILNDFVQLTLTFGGKVARAEMGGGGCGGGEQSTINYGFHVRNASQL